MSTFKNISLFAVPFIVCLTWLTTDRHVGAVTAYDRRTMSSIATRPQGPFIVDMQDAKDFIDTMCQAAEFLNDYSFQFEMTVYKPHGEVKEEGRFYFKKPRLIRLEEVGDYKKGAVAVLQSNGKVKAHLGGALKFFVVTLDPNSDYLRSANEYPMAGSDFLSLAQFLKDWHKEGMHSRVTDKPLALEGHPNKVHVVEMYRPNNAKEVFKRVFVDEKTKLPVQWYDFRDGHLWSKSIFKDVKTNIGLDDTFFQIKEH